MIAPPVLNKPSEVQATVDFALTGNRTTGFESLKKSILTPSAVVVVAISGMAANHNPVTNLEAQKFMNSNVREYNNPDPNHTKYLGEFTGVVNKVNYQHEMNTHPLEEVYDHINHRAKPKKVIEFQDEIQVIKKVQSSHSYSRDNLLVGDVNHKAKPKRVFEI
jgi:hypothetical protein